LHPPLGLQTPTPANVERQHEAKDGHRLNTSIEELKPQHPAVGIDLFRLERGPAASAFLSGGHNIRQLLPELRDDERRGGNEQEK
jgi:hypothetical protein